MADWIEGFLDYTSRTNSPDIYRKWAAIAVLSGVAERKTWIKTSIGVLYPNLYVLLVGPPGVGKSVMTDEIYAFWKAVKGLQVAPSSVTKASLIDALDAAKRHIIRPNEVPSAISFNTLLFCSSEFGVLLPAYDNEFMAVLTDLYDCKQYSETRRSNKISIEIKHVQLSITAGCTPSYLMNTMPEGAWDQGFASRLLMIYSGETKLVDLFTEIENQEVAFDVLKKELSERSNRYGRLVFTEEAASAVMNWRRQGEQPKPDHPKLFHYNTRRTAHLLKLAMIANLSENLDNIITTAHIERALDWLVEAEYYMPDIFRAMSGTTHSQLIDETWHFIYTSYNKGKKEPVAQARVMNFLQTRTPAHNVARVLEVMEQSNVIKRVLSATGNAYIPQGREP